MHAQPSAGLEVTGTPQLGLLPKGNWSLPMNLRVSYSDMLYFVRWAWARSDLKCRSQIFVVVVVVVVVVGD